jgi:hypothetical protein
MLASLLRQLDASGVPSEEVTEGLLWTVVRFPEEPTRHPRALLSTLGPVHGSSGWALAAGMNLKWRIPAETLIESQGQLPEGTHVRSRATPVERSIHHGAGQPHC